MSTHYKIVVNEGTQDDPGDHFFCSLCGFPLRTAVDFQMHSDHSCCGECYLTFVEPSKSKWQEGHRPKKSEIRKYINSRKKLIISVDKHQELL